MGGCWPGMHLCVNLAYGLIPCGTKIGRWAVAAYQAEAVRNVFGNFGWVAVLLIGFRALWGTQLGCTDGFVRVLQFVANMASFVFFLSGIKVLILNSKLPREVQGGWLTLFYGAIVFMAVANKVFGVKF